MSFHAGNFALILCALCSCAPLQQKQATASSAQETVGGEPPTAQGEIGNNPANGKATNQNSELKQVYLAPRLVMLQSACCNAGVAISDTGNLLVDTMLKGNGSEEIVPTLAKAGFGETKLVINTHGHPDHVGGNEIVASKGAIVVGHTKLRERLSSEQRIELLGFSAPPLPAIALPTVELKDELWLHFGERIHILNFENAHSHADSIVHFIESNAIFMGDIFIGGMYPLVFVEEGGSINGLLKVLGTIIALSDDATKIVPGHGQLSNKKGLVAYRDALEIIRSRIAKEIENGKSLAEVLAVQPTKEFDEAWSWSLMDGTKFTIVLYRSLSEQRK